MINSANLTKGLKMKLNINLTVTILDVENIVSDRGTTQAEYRIKMIRGTSNPFTVSYVDSGNNAEYESHLETISSGAGYLLNFNDNFETALHEYLDSYAYDLKSGAFLVYSSEKCEFKAFSGAFVAFCPIGLTVSNAFSLARPHLKSGHVAVVSNRDVNNILFRGPKANSYGYDLYLYHIDADNNETYLDCGNFN